MVDEVTEQLERPYPSEQWELPAEVQLSRDRRLLLWRCITVDGGTGLPMDLPGETASRAPILNSFARLGVGKPGKFADRVLTYARRWGVLELCPSHGLPASHNATWYGLAGRLMPDDYARPEGCEPIFGGPFLESDNGFQWGGVTSRKVV